jgi:hypothetical protein
VLEEHHAKRKEKKKTSKTSMQEHEKMQE